MANAFLTPELVAREALFILQNNLVFGNIVYKGVSPDFANGVGDTINVRKPSAIAARQFAGTQVTQDNIAETSVPVKLDHHMYVQIPITSEDLSMNIQRFSEQVITPALIGHAQAVDAAIAAEYFRIPFREAVSGTPAVSDIAKVGAGLSVNKVPFSGRRLVMHPTTHAKYIPLDAFLNADKRGGDIGAIRDAEIGRVLGLDCYVDQNIVKHVKGTYSAGKVSGAAGDTTVTISALNAPTATVATGDMFTVTGKPTVYTVIKGGTGSGSSVSVDIFPGLADTESTTDLVLIDASGYNGLAFHETAFCLAMKPLAAPTGQPSEVVSFNGLSVRVVYGWDNDLLSDVITIDTLWGVKTLDPNRAVRLIG